MTFNVAVINGRIHRRILEKKNRVERHRPLHPDLVKIIGEQVLVEYVHSSNVLEGNTLTLGETETVIRGMTVGGKTIQEIQEARNHPGAVDYIMGIARGRAPVTEETIRKVHRLLLEGILEEPGEYRTGMIAVPGASFTPPRSAEIPRLLRELVDWLEDNPWEYSPVELAARFMHRLLTIHPFHDGNGRTARILMNLALLRNGYPTLTNISYRDRKRYLAALGEADLDNPEPLVNFVAMSVEEALTKYLIAIEELETLSLREAAERSPYSTKYLNLRARDGSLGAYKRGRNWRVTREDLENYVRDNQG
jgi:excisionase family DNA binding protein